MGPPSAPVSSIALRSGNIFPDSFMATSIRCSRVAYIWTPLCMIGLPSITFNRNAMGLSLLEDNSSRR